MTKSMNKLFALIMPIGIAMGCFLPLQAQPRAQLFDSDSHGIMGCQGQAAPRSGEQWGSPIYAAWTLGDEKTVVMPWNGQLESYVYEFSRDRVNNRTRISWSIPGYTVEVFFSSKRTGYESSGGNGSMRIFSRKSGDSQSIPIRVDTGC